METFLQGPKVYLPLLILALAITIILYGAFPLLFALTRKKRITVKKYKFLCYGWILLVCIFDAIVSGGGPRIVSYFLWTGIFHTFGKRILTNKGILYDPEGMVWENNQDYIVECKNCGHHSETYFEACPKCGQFAKRYVLAQSQANAICAIRFCRKCGTEMSDGSRFCRKCGTEVKL